MEISVEKYAKFVKSLRGITYKEWKELSGCINEHFSGKLDELTDDLSLTDFESMVDIYLKKEKE